TKSGTSKKTTTGTRLVTRSADRSQTAKTVALEQLFKKTEQTDLPEIKQTDSIGISIRLPNNMSLRSISKAKAISVILSDRSAERVRRLAYATSFGFILLGGFYTLGSL